MSTYTPPPGTVLGMGNPLLDISAVVPQEFLDKYEVRNTPPDLFYVFFLCGWSTDKQSYAPWEQHSAT